MPRRVALVLILVLTQSGCESADTPSHEDFELGASRERVVSRFGSPQRQHSLTKRDVAVWGAIEEFWTQLPVGTSVDVWIYQSNHTGSGAGTTELYYLDGSDVVNAIGFAPAGAVYEAGSDGRGGP